MKRTRITLEDIAERANLSLALHKAAMGKHHREQVSRFLIQANSHLNQMDDIVWWCVSKEGVKQVLQQVQTYLLEQRQLTIKPGWQIQQSSQGISYCGYRILPGVVRLSLRRKRNYQKRRLYWEGQYQQGNISATQLQACYAAVQAILQGTDNAAWRKQNLSHHPPLSV